MRIETAAAALLTTSLAFAVYNLTLAPDLTWANYGSDGGELITAAVTLGVPHPSGYPTYILIGKLFSLLPWGEVAYRLNLLSATAVALAAGFTTAASFHLLTNHFNQKQQMGTAVAVGLTFALAPLVWGQATISEVYGLNLLCLSLFLWALLGERPSWFTGLFLGLSITTHLTSLLMLPLAILCIERRNLPKLGVGVGIGLLPFLLIPFIAQSGSPIIWSNPTTLSGWWWLVSGHIYRPNLFSLPPDQLLLRLSDWTWLLSQQFAWIGFIVLGIGVWQIGRQPDLHPLRRLTFGLLFTAVIYLIYAFTYNTDDAIVLILPTLLLLTPLLTIGLRRIGWIALSLPLFLLLLNFQTQNLSDDHRLRPLATNLLSTAPTNALILSSDAATTFSLWYFHFAEGQRPDTILVDTHLFAFDWYRDQLQTEYPDLYLPQTDDLAVFERRNGSIRPLCHAQIKPDQTPAYSLNCQDNQL
ncbi:MAG: DUF2723 domain-containing protein [Chloroflexi bacterium]|nr:DUF2723 domain-containing protein [Chloroflexota bacterium]